MKFLHLLCCCALLTFAPAVFAGEAAPTITLGGLVAHPQTLTLAALQAFPKETLTVTFMTGHGEQKGTYTGAHLWDVLKAAHVVDQGHNANLKRTIWIEGRDGYQIVMSLSELDPDYGNHDALLAYARGDNPPGKDGFRLVIPTDRHGGRAVNEVAKIEVK